MRPCSMKSRAAMMRSRLKTMGDHLLSDCISFSPAVSAVQAPCSRGMAKSWPEVYDISAFLVHKVDRSAVPAPCERPHDVGAGHIRSLADAGLNHRMNKNVDGRNKPA